MGVIKDLTGMKFGKLTVLYQVDKPEDMKESGIYWLCECECGNRCVRLGRDLKRKNRNPRCSECRFENLAGMKFGKLTVIEKVENHVCSNGATHSKWKCLCDCQLSLPESERKYSYVVGSALKNGGTSSCGCNRVHQTRYELNEEYGIGYTYNGDKFYFDLEDYDKIKDYNWYVDSKGYICSGSWSNLIRMHRLVLGLSKDDTAQVPDHISGERNDNRKSNLRLATYSQNCMNARISKNNQTGVTGVGYHDGRWRARIRINNQSIHLGNYNTKENAIKARKDAEDILFKEFSYDNSQQIAQKSKRNN